MKQKPGAMTESAPKGSDKRLRDAQEAAADWSTPATIEPSAPTPEPIIALREEEGGPFIRAVNDGILIADRPAYGFEAVLLRRLIAAEAEVAQLRQMLENEGINVDGTRKANAELDRVLSMTDDEINAQLIAEGIDPAIAADNTKYAINQVIQLVTLRRELAALRAEAGREREAVAEACNIGLAIAGHFHPNTPVDPWLAAHEKRLRELEPTAAREQTK